MLVISLLYILNLQSQNDLINRPNLFKGSVSFKNGKEEENMINKLSVFAADKLRIAANIGRHPRLMADILITKVFGKSYFTWGSVNLTKASEARTKYLQTLRAADQNDHKLLVEFTRL